MNTSMKLGKKFELRFLYDLQGLDKKYQIFLPFIDDSGIDFVIRGESGKYREIQVKGRKDKRLFTIKSDLAQYSNYWFVFYCQDEAEPYVLSAKEILDKKLWKAKGSHVCIPRDYKRKHHLDDLVK